MISVVMLIFSLYFAWLSINLVDLKECGKPGVQVLSTLIWISFWISWPHAAVLNFLIDPKVLLDIESWYMKWPQHLCIVIFFKNGLQGNPLMMSLFCPLGGSSVLPLGGIMVPKKLAWLWIFHFEAHILKDPIEISDMGNEIAHWQWIVFKCTISCCWNAEEVAVVTKTEK